MGTGDKSSRSLDVRMRQNESRSQGLSCDVCDEFRFSLIAAVKLATANIVSRFTLYSQSGAKSGAYDAKFQLCFSPMKIDQS